MVLTSTYLSVINFFVVGHVSGGNLILFAKKKKSFSLSESSYVHKISLEEFLKSWNL